MLPVVCGSSYVYDASVYVNGNMGERDIVEKERCNEMNERKILGSQRSPVGFGGSSIQKRLRGRIQNIDIGGKGRVIASVFDRSRD